MLNKDENIELIRLLEENQKRKLLNYAPYPKQREFHKSGLTKRERLFMAANQVGKTLAGAAEAAMHATGRYPEWWGGRKIEKQNDGWCSGVTGEVVRDTVQRLLIGSVGREGSGFIPERDIVEKIMSRGVQDLVDTLLIRNQFGGVSRIKLKYYEQGREKFQSDTIDWAWDDEEPPQDIYSEILTRTNATGGFVWTTFTPLLGMSEVVRRFLNEPSPDRDVINMTIDDAGHISPEQKAKIIASYPAHEREARTKGKPMLGSGRIFPLPEEAIKCRRFQIPEWFLKIGGLDFGWDHPTAAIKLAYDPDADIVYLTNVTKQREVTPTIFVSSVRPWLQNVPVAWPHDGLQHDKGSGEQLAEIYRKEGLLMLPERSTFEDGTNGVEAGIMLMLTRMENGRFKVFEELEAFFDEFRMYHRKDGKVVKEYDDILAAVRIAMMSLRFARTEMKELPKGRHGESVHQKGYDPLDRQRVRAECGGPSYDPLGRKRY